MQIEKFTRNAKSKVDPPCELWPIYWCIRPVILRPVLHNAPPCQTHSVSIHSILPNWIDRICSCAVCWILSMSLHTALMQNSSCFKRTMNFDFPYFVSSDDKLACKCFTAFSLNLWSTDKTCSITRPLFIE